MQRQQNMLRKQAAEEKALDIERAIHRMEAREVRRRRRMRRGGGGGGGGGGG